MLLEKEGYSNIQIHEVEEAGHLDRDVPGLRYHPDVYRLILRL